MSMPATSTKTTKLATSLIDEYALLGWRAMLTEVNLSPKPGLVDYSAAIFLIPICISFDTDEKRRYATYLILNRRFSFEF